MLPCLNTAACLLALVPTSKASVLRQLSPAETKREIKRLRLARFVNELSPLGWRGLVEGPEGTGWNTGDGPGHGERHPALGERQ